MRNSAPQFKGNEALLPLPHVPRSHDSANSPDLNRSSIESLAEPVQGAPKLLVAPLPASAVTKLDANTATQAGLATQSTVIGESVPAPEVLDLLNVVPPDPIRNKDESNRVAPSETKVTLDQAINACLLADPKLRAGFEAVNQAYGDSITASLKPNPTLFTDVQLLPLTRPFTVTRQGGPPQQDVNLSYPIDWFLFGKRAAEMATAARGIQVSQSEYADLIRRRVLEATLAYIDLAEATALRELARENFDNLTRLQSLTQKAVDAGGRPQVELDRVRLDLLLSNQTLRDAGLTVATARAQLRAVTGGTIGEHEFEVEIPPEPALGGDILPIDDAVAVALENRPDLRALRWKISQAGMNVETQRRKAYPEVAPQFGYTHQYQEKAIGFPDANSWSAAVTMSVPLHDRNQGNRARAASEASQAAWELRLAEIELRTELESSVETLRTAKANAEAVAQEQLRIAARVRDSINTAYESGGRPLIDVLDAQRNYRETYRLYISSRAGYWRALYEYNTALGTQVAPP